ncbi:MAG TPA: TonB-dependent receptor plug domain-containing protein [Gemmatimonadaceae bacterium]|nr:TonB-dependent receptor plug domain-containing protein [Gemmatimonadaceae bacterium]
MRVRSMCMCGAALATLPLTCLRAQDTTRAAQKLETVTVKDSADFISVRLAGFERRRLLKPGSVTFITGEEITKRGTIRLSDALRRAHGVVIVDSENGDKLVASSRTQLPSGGGFLVRGVAKRRVAGHVAGDDGGASATAGLAPCIMPIAVDGQLKEKSFPIDEIAVNDVHGIEVYPGAGSLPAEFGSIKPDGWCGLVMIWTRSR